MASVVWRNVSFTVPWGVISGKECGPSSGKPFLGLHGLLDNANTYNKLAPFLPKDVHFVVVDFPGHGRSSHKPPGATYDYLDRVTDVRRVVNQLQWKEFSIIGHSTGGVIAALYAGTFPTDIRHLLLIDIGFSVKYEEANPAETLARFINRSLSGKQIKPTTYSDIAAVVAKLVNTSNVGMTESAARVLAERGCVLKEDGSGFVFSHDKKLRNGFSHVPTVEFYKAVLSRIECNVLCANTRFLSTSVHRSSIDERIAVIGENAQSFVLEVIPGGHHVHVDNPEMVARRIEEFINSRPNTAISKL